MNQNFYDDENHFDDQCQRVGIVDFDYEQVDRMLSEEEIKAVSKIPQADLEAAEQAFRVLVKWIFQRGMRCREGVSARAIICCWIYLSELRHLSLTEMATAFGLHKQSLGRWVTIFKRDFPNVRLPHMKRTPRPLVPISPIAHNARVLPKPLPIR
jgi:hypothetical protein